MIIVMEHNASQKQIDRVTKYIEDRGMKSYIHKGDLLNVVAVIGDEINLNPENIAALEGVSTVKKIQEAYKLVSRVAHPEDTIIKFPNGVKIGGLEKPILMVGPCSVEKDFDGLLQVATAAKEMGCQFLRGGAFKPRTSPYDFQGLEEKGLQYLAQAREKTGLLVITEVMDTMDISLLCKYADVLQVGARNMQNFKLLKALGRIKKPVMIKRGPAATIKMWESVRRGEEKYIFPYQDDSDVTINTAATYEKIKQFHANLSDITEIEFPEGLAEIGEFAFSKAIFCCNFIIRCGVKNFRSIIQTL